MSEAAARTVGVAVLGGCAAAAIALKVWDLVEHLRR